MSAVASPIGAVTFSFSEESVQNGPPGQGVNPSALLHSFHAEPLTRPVCRVFFVLCLILPMVLGLQRCSRYRFTQPVRRRLTFGPSEGSACTSRPWVVMTTQIRIVPVCACVFEFLCPVVCMLTLRCAHAFFTSFEPHIMVCLSMLSAGSVIVFSIAWRKVAFRSSFAVCLWTLGYLTSRRVKCTALISWTC